MRASLVALVLGLVSMTPITGRADPVVPPGRAATVAPPKLFRDLVAAVGKAGFHRNTKEKRWKAGAVCPGLGRPDAFVCTNPPAIWFTSIVADDDSDVVQELWLFEAATAGDAALVQASLEHDFEYGPFAKHPYTIYLHGTSVVAIEGRFRWRSAGKKLAAAVEKFLAARARAKAP